MNLKKKLNFAGNSSTVLILNDICYLFDNFDVNTLN